MADMETQNETAVQIYVLQSYHLKVTETIETGFRTC